MRPWPWRTQATGIRTHGAPDSFFVPILPLLATSTLSSSSSPVFLHGPSGITATKFSLNCKVFMHSSSSSSLCLSAQFSQLFLVMFLAGLKGCHGARYCLGAEGVLRISSGCSVSLMCKFFVKNVWKEDFCGYLSLIYYQDVLPSSFLHNCGHQEARGFKEFMAF